MIIKYYIAQNVKNVIANFKANFVNNAKNAIMKNRILIAAKSAQNVTLDCQINIYIIVKLIRNVIQMFNEIVLLIAIHAKKDIKEKKKISSIAKIALIVIMALMKNGTIA